MSPMSRVLLCSAGQLMSAVAVMARPLPPGEAYAVRTTGFLGVPYQYAQGSGFGRQLFGMAIASNGWVFGKTIRYSIAGSIIGVDLWVDKGQGPILINPADGEYSFTTGVSVLRQATYVTGGAISRSLSPTGQAWGSSSRWASDGTALPNHPWVYDGVSTTVFPTWTSSTAPGPDGDVGYRVSRGTGLGEDGFVRLADGTSRPLGLSGPDYERVTAGGVYRSTIPVGVGGGFVVGTNARGTGLGQDAWVDLGGGSVRVNPTGPGYEYQTATGILRSSTAALTEGVARASGHARRYSDSGVSLGQDAWVVDGGTTRVLAMTGTPYEVPASGGNFRSTSVTHGLPDGRWLVQANRYGATSLDSRGHDVLVHDGVGGAVIGLTGGDYEFLQGAVSTRASRVQAVSASGIVGGASSRYAAGGASAGSDAWLWASGTTVRVNPLGGMFESGQAISERMASVTSVNDAGQAIGSAWVYGTNGARIGSAAYFFDSATGVTTPLIFSTGPDGRGFSSASILTASGFVLGSYTLFDGTNALGSRAFMWSGSTGFTDLTSVAQGLGLSGFDFLAGVVDVYGATSSGTPLTIVGRGQAVGEFTVGTGYVLTLVPNPGTAGLMAIVGVFASRRRRG